MKTILGKYRILRDDVDRRIKELLDIHCDRIHCTQRCANCCINLTVWPVEFFAILEDLKTAHIRPVFDEAAACGFLKDGLCQIYPYRPIICRTHGLPLVYLDDTADEPAYGVTFCEKNFQEAEEMEFGPENTLAMDEINDRLARLHTAYLEAGGQEGPDGHGRIALARLVGYLSVEHTE